jgi:hypothetical protein
VITDEGRRLAGRARVHQLRVPNLSSESPNGRSMDSLSPNHSISSTLPASQPSWATLPEKVGSSSIKSNFGRT